VVEGTSWVVVVAVVSGAVLGVSTEDVSGVDDRDGASTSGMENSLLDGLE
jgi:hypothetical protein